MIDIRWRESNYRALLLRPGMKNLAISSLLGRLAFAMTNLSLLLYVTETTGELSIGGAAAGTSLLGSAISASLQGRWFDRFGVSRTLLSSIALYVPVTVLLIVLLRSHAEAWVLLSVILVQSLVAPMMGVASRSVLPFAAPDGPLRDALIRYWTISFEVCYAMAPAIVGVLTLGDRTAEVPFYVAAVSLAVTSAAYAASPIVRAQVPRSPTSPAQAARRSSGGGVATLTIAALAFGAGVGFVVITVTAIAKSLGNPEIVGLPFSLMTISSVAAGFWFSHHEPSLPRHLQLAALIAVCAVALLIPTFLTGASMTEIIVCCIVAGFSFAPQLILQSTILEEICAPERVGATFGWLTTAVTVGNAAGQTLGGALSQWFTPGVAAGTGVVILASMALIVSLSGRTFKPAHQ